MKKHFFKLIACFCMFSTVLSVSPNYIYADPGVNFESLTEKYGDIKDNYIYTVKYGERDCKVAYCEEDITAETYTRTNIRTGPDISTKVIDTLEPGTKVKVWGAADKGWIKVYCPNKNGENLFGYIWADLLNLSESNSSELTDETSSVE